MASLGVAAIAPAVASACVHAPVQLPVVAHATLTADLQQPNFRHHVYDIAVKADGSFTGTGAGSMNADGTGQFATETINGQLTIFGKVSFVATYDGTAYGNPYVWKVTNATLGVPSNQWPEGISTITTLSNFHFVMSAGLDRD